MGIGIRRIRSFVPQVLAAPEPVVEETPPVPQPKKARRKQPTIPIMHEEALGVRYADFGHLPPEVWNQLVGAIRDGLRSLCRTVDDAYQANLEQQLGRLLDQGIPDAVYALGRDVMQGVLSRERGYLGSKLVCDACGDVLGFEGNKPRSFLTRLGEITACRSYYVGACGHSVFPLDTLLGIQEHDALPAIQEEIAFLAADLSYGKAVATVQRLLPITISNQTVQRVTATVAGQIQAEQEADRKTAFGDPVNAAFPEPVGVPSGPVAVVAVDGGMCRIRDQEDFSEFKVGVLGTINPSNATPDQPAPVEGKHYVAHFADADTIFEYVNVEYHRLGLHRCSVLHILGDGAPWIWSRGKELCHEGQEYIPTLDYYHVAEHLANLGKVLFGSEAQAANNWSKAMRARLDNDELDSFFTELQSSLQWATRQAGKERAEAVRLELEYFQDRRAMLNYKQCRERGLPIGSGMVEGGIRFVGKDRLHRTGMRWHVTGAEASRSAAPTRAVRETHSLNAKRRKGRRRSIPGQQHGYKRRRLPTIIS